MSPTTFPNGVPFVPDSILLFWSFFNLSFSLLSSITISFENPNTIAIAAIPNPIIVTLSVDNIDTEAELYSTLQQVS